MAENQQAHRLDIEKIAVGGASRRSWWGLWLGFAIAVVIFVLGTIMVMTGNGAAGATVMSTDVVSLAGVFIYGRNDQKKERVAKDSHTHTPRIEPTSSN
jgi:uncharacterized membrane protein